GEVAVRLVAADRRVDHREPAGGRYRPGRGRRAGRGLITAPAGDMAVRQEGEMERVEAELLIPGEGEPVSDGVVIIDGPAISYAGPASQAPATPGALVHRTETVMPGMWDCHGHFLGMRTLDLGRIPLDPVPLRAARCTHDLAAALRAGITSVREV